MQDLNNKVNNGGATNDGKLFHNEWNEAATELQNVITDDGTVLSSGVLTQLIAAIAQLSRGRSFWGTDSGSGSAYIVTGISSAAVTLFAGFTIKFRPANNNTVVSPTVNFNGSGVKTITNEAGAPLVIGDLNTLRDAELRYDGTNFRLLNRCLTLTQTGIYDRSYISTNGFYMSNDTVSPNTVLSVNPGYSVSDDASLNLILATTFKKRIDAVWALGGSSVGGRASSVSLTANTFYRVFLIGGASAATDVGFDTSSVATNLLSDATSVTGNTYNKYRQIGWIRTNGSSNIVPFYMDLSDYSYVYWQTPYANFSGNNIGTTRNSVVVDAPVQTQAIISLNISANPSGTNTHFVDVRPTAMTDIAADATNNVLKAENMGSGSFSLSANILVLTDGSRQIAVRFGGSGVGTNSFYYALTTRGYRMVR